MIVRQSGLSQNEGDDVLAVNYACAEVPLSN